MENDKLKNMIIPTVAGVAGSAVAVALTKKPKQLVDAMPKQLGEVMPRVRDAIPDGGIGEITDDLKGRLDSVLGKDEEEQQIDAGFEGQTPSNFDSSKFEQRREKRRQRREQRRGRAA